MTRQDMFKRAGEIVYARHMAAALPGFRGIASTHASLQQALSGYSQAADRAGEQRQGVCAQHPGGERTLYRVLIHDRLRGEDRIEWLCADCIGIRHTAVFA